jgi:hypothetical protein
VNILLLKVNSASAGCREGRFTAWRRGSPARPKVAGISRRTSRGPVLADEEETAAAAGIVEDVGAIHRGERLGEIGNAALVATEYGFLWNVMPAIRHAHLTRRSDSFVLASPM